MPFKPVAMTKKRKVISSRRIDTKDGRGTAESTKTAKAVTIHAQSQAQVADLMRAGYVKK